MKYISTRGKAPAIEFEDVLLAGLATDGGLYVPETYPYFSKEQMRNMRSMSYFELAAEIMAPFTEGCLSRDDLLEIAKQAYNGFYHTAVAPMKQIKSGLWVMELFYGPTLAFKDYALQIVGRMFDTVLKRTNRHITILGATSGDTGSAAIEACKDCSNLDIFIQQFHGQIRKCDLIESCCCLCAFGCGRGFFRSRSFGFRSRFRFRFCLPRDSVRRKEEISVLTGFPYQEDNRTVYFPCPYT